MKTLISIVNIKNVLHELSRKSVIFTASRWGCDFIEITASLPKMEHPAFLKLQCNFTDYDKVLILDADTLIAPSCPNIFELFEGPAAVNGVHPNLVNYATLAKECDEELLFFGLTQKDLKFYFNSGVFLINNNCSTELEHAREIYRSCECIKKLRWWDQTIFNVAFKNKNIEELPEAWNFIPQGRDISNAFIIHLAGTTNRTELISKYYQQLYENQ